MRGSTAIVGIGEAGIGTGMGYTHLELLSLAVSDALAEANVNLDQVDGLFTANLVNFFPTLTVAEYLGISPTVMDGTNLGGGSFENFLMSAALALNAGLCSVALICYGSNARSGSGKHTTMAETPPYEAPYRPRLPITAYALAAARHMHEFGTTRTHLAEVAVAARRWAQLTPNACERGDLSVEDVLAAKMISSPLTVRDCCLVTDGAGAVVMTRTDRAKHGPKPPVYLLGAASATSHRQISAMPDLTSTAATVSGTRAYAMAGVNAGDIDLAMLYDAFTINVLLFLEDLGFCGKGDGGAFVENGGIAPGGRLPVNTNGGGLSYCHPGMFGVFQVVEAVRQLRGEAGQRQVRDAHVALCHGNGGTLSSQCSAVLGSVATVG